MLGPRALASEAEPRSEELLCRAALQGDSSAWSALIAKHNHRVIVALIAFGVAPDRARDLAQEVWLRLIEQQRSGRLPTLALPGLALRQARYFALDLLRRDGVQPLSVDTAALDKALDPSPGVEQRVLDEEQLKRALHALDECHPTAQRVFVAVYEDPDRPQHDVAREVGLSLQRVRQVLCEVRKKLRAAIEGAGP
jgi:RNA polymerase sigma factor (sigma-70 family)